MLTTMLDLYNHHPSEDTTTTALLVLGVLKAAAVLKVVRQKTFNGYQLAFYSPLDWQPYKCLFHLNYLFRVRIS